MPRTLRLITLRALAGLVLTIAVAWAGAVFLPYPSTIDPILSRGLNKRDWLSIGAAHKPAGVRYFSVVMLRAFEYKEQTTGRTVPFWAAFDEPEPSTPTRRAEHYELADGYGWPMPALGFRFHGRGVGAATTGDVTGGITLPPRSTGAWYDARALPLTPLWLGLMVDWAVAACLVALLWGGPRQLRRWRRTRRGQCLRCGYDLRGLAGGPCPECGGARAAPVNGPNSAVPEPVLPA